MVPVDLSSAGPVTWEGAISVEGLPDDGGGGSMYTAWRLDHTKLTEFAPTPGQVRAWRGRQWAE